ncbi:MAG: c-type cytochrome [Gammaproteobacteria bacterium]
MKIEVFIDGKTAPHCVLTPPETFSLDTTLLDDGPHVIRFKAIDTDGSISVREIPFTVRNGPGIAVHGIVDHDVVRERVSVLANAYSSTVGDTFEPMRIETPAPIPTWAWLVVLATFAWGMWYLGIELHARNAEIATAEIATSGNERVAAAASWKVLGEQVYGNYCASCHQASGEGLAGVFPPLKSAAVVLAEDPAEHGRIVVQGLTGKVIDGVTYSSPMPSFAEQLSDEAIAAVVNHERTSWGNAAPLITAEQVAALR